ncbi:MAG: peptide chain release factor N(5)-glutamine methyltransferase [Deltaproteobacteria bacterium]|nr:peptide chain release factor N(5)-glutamine methyltransferase [Deltaproteobacteria bacterium]
MKHKKTERIVDILNTIEDQLKKCHISTPRLDAEVLVGHYVNRDRSALYRNGDYRPTDEELQGLQTGVARRIKGEPIAYITGIKEFFSLEFEVNHHVLIPRPETEILVEEILRLIGNKTLQRGKILEIGTGCGAISIALATELTQFYFFAADISQKALTVAKRNARRNGVAERIFFLCGNLLESLSEQFDIIVSNPPYISDEEFKHISFEIRNHEPRTALIAGPDGTEFHQALIRNGGPHLRKGGWLIMEMGYGQWETIERLLRESQKYDYIRCQYDYAGIERVATARRR